MIRAHWNLLPISEIFHIRSRLHQRTSRQAVQLFLDELPVVHSKLEHQVVDEPCGCKEVLIAWAILSVDRMIFSARFTALNESEIARKLGKHAGLHALPP